MPAKNSISNFKKWLNLPWVQVFLTLILLLVIRFYPFFFNQSPIYGDNFSLMVPGKLFTSFWMQKSIFPLWNPTILGGISWVGDVNQSLFYLSTWLFLFFSPGWALNINLLIHLGLTFIGTYLVAKKLNIKHFGALVASIVWTLSPQLTGAINNLSIIQSLAWVPWVVLAGMNLNKKLNSKLVFSLTVVAQFLAGYPQHILFTILLGVIFSLFTQPQKISWLWFKHWLMTGILTISITSFIWLPFLENLTSSTRIIQSTSQLATGSLHPVELIKFIFPYFFEKPTAGYRWGVNWNGFPNLGLYVSWLGLLLPLIVWQTKKLKSSDRFYLGVIGVSLLLSLGGYLPGFVFLQKLLPFGSAMRGPSIVLLITTFVAALWIGELFTRVKSVANFKFLQRSLLLGILGSLVLLVLVRVHFDWVYRLVSPYLTGVSFFNFSKLEVILTAFATHLWWHFLFLGLAWWGLRKSKLLVVVILIFDLVFFTQGHLFFAPTTLYQLPAAPVFSQLNDPQARILTRNFNQPYTDYGAYWDALSIRQPFSDSYVDQIELQNWAHLSRMKTGLTPDWNMPLQLPMIHGYTTLLPQDINAAFNHSLVPAINYLPVIEVDNELLKKWAVKYYLVDTWFPYPTGVENLPPLAQKEQWQLYELEALSRFRYENDQSIEFEQYAETPNEIKFSFDNVNNQRQLILADRYDKNWQVEVNGRKVTLENYQGMRKIGIKPGRNEVRFSYVPRWFYWGLGISGLTVLYGGGWLLIEKMNL